MLGHISVQGAAAARAMPSASTGDAEGSRADVSDLLKSALSIAFGPASNPRGRVGADLGALLSELTDAGGGAASKRGLAEFDAKLQKLTEKLEAMRLERTERTEETQEQREAKIQAMVEAMLDRMLILLDTNPMAALKMASKIKNFVSSALSEGGIGSEMESKLKATLKGITEFIEVLTKAFSAGHIKQVDMFIADISPEAGAALNKALASIPF